MINLNKDGSFQDEVMAGNYKINPCPYSCLWYKPALPEGVFIEANKKTESNIKIN